MSDPTTHTPDGEIEKKIQEFERFASEARKAGAESVAQQLEEKAKELKSKRSQSPLTEKELKVDIKQSQTILILAMRLLSSAAV